MSDVINPSNSPRGAAQQVVLELIKAGKISGGSDGQFVINAYENLVKEYERINEKK